MLNIRQLKSIHGTNCGLEYNHQVTGAAPGENAVICHSECRATSSLVTVEC